LRADSILAAVAEILAAISLPVLRRDEALGLWWADAVAALIVSVIVLPAGWSSLGATATA
jgi:divalent metal cation (Fe/Co/Zn/Cd) transporter